MNRKTRRVDYCVGGYPLERIAMSTKVAMSCAVRVEEEGGGNWLRSKEGDES